MKLDKAVKINELTTALEYADKTNMDLRAEVERLRAENQALKTEVERLRAENQDLKTEVERLQAAFSSLIKAMRG